MTADLPFAIGNRYRRDDDNSRIRDLIYTAMGLDRHSAGERNHTSLLGNNLNLKCRIQCRRASDGPRNAHGTEDIIDTTQGGYHGIRERDHTYMDNVT